MSIRVLVAIVLAVFAAGCTSSADAGDAEIQRATEPMAQPSGEVVLTATGGVLPNSGDELVLDVETIESVGTETVVIFEPFLNEEIEFTAVRLDALLAAAGVSDDATLVWTALDNYQVSFTVDDIASEPTWLATRQDGELIGIADGGPIRILFGDAQGRLGRDTNQWIWSIYLLEVG